MDGGKVESEKEKKQRIMEMEREERDIKGLFKVGM